MKTERVDHAFGEMLEQATPEMTDGWEARAREALRPTKTAHRQKLRPRHLLLAAVFLFYGGAAATTIWFPFEGSLHFRRAHFESPGDFGILGSLFVAGDGVIEGDIPSDHSDICEATNQAVFFIGGKWPPTASQIYTMDLSSPDEGWVCVSDAAGLTGINCSPSWSPDGSMILFQRSDYDPERPPCEVGFQVWAMTADGSAAWQVTSEDMPTAWAEDWSPDGSRVLVSIGDGGAATMDVYGQDIQVLPNVDAGGRYSPDGQLIASSATIPAELDGVLGVWRQLLLTNADGSDPEVLIEQFLVDVEIEALFPGDWHRQDDCRHKAGPQGFVWSPDGTKIAFIAAMPFDPEGPYYRNQTEAWVYDLETDELTQVTDDDEATYALIWRP